MSTIPVLGSPTSASMGPYFHSNPSGTSPSSLKQRQRRNRSSSLSSEDSDDILRFDEKARPNLAPATRRATEASTTSTASATSSSSDLTPTTSRTKRFLNKIRFSRRKSSDSASSSSSEAETKANTHLKREASIPFKYRRWIRPDEVESATYGTYHDKMGQTQKQKWYEMDTNMALGWIV